MDNEIKITYPRGWRIKFAPKPPVCGCCFEATAVISGMCQGCYDASCGIVDSNNIDFEAWWNEPDDKEVSDET